MLRPEAAGYLESTSALVRPDAEFYGGKMKTRIWATMSEARAEKLLQRRVELTKKWFDLELQRAEKRTEIQQLTREMGAMSSRLNSIEKALETNTESIWIECRLEPTSDTEYKIIRTDTGETVGSRPRSAADLARDRRREAREIARAAERDRQTRLFD